MIRRLTTAFLLAGPFTVALAGPAAEVDIAEVRHIYARLCAAAGLVQGAPELQFDETSQKGAGAFTDFSAHPTRIVVERKALTTCAGLGEHAKDGIAFLLGHELAHYSMGHGWGTDLKHFGDHASARQNVEQAMKNNRVYHLFETQADQKGAFYAYIAGYEPEAIADTLVGRLYSTYGWSDKQSGYPDRPVREALLRAGLGHFHDMSMALRLADHRLILGQYVEAERLYTMLMDEGFRNPMLYTNAGVCHLLTALAAAPPRKPAFVYPLELDQRERWRGGGASFEESLRKAEDLFLQAYLMDRSAHAAIADLACIELIRRDTDGAAHWIKVHGGIAGSNTRTRAILNAILSAERGATDQARAALSAPELKNDPIALLNLSALDGKEAAAYAALPLKPANAEERIAGKSLSDLAKGFGPPLVVRKDTVLYHQTGNDHWGLAAERNGEGPQAHWIYLGGTRAGYAARSAKGISIGQGRADIVKAYGPPDRTLHTLEGELCIHAQHGIIFMIDQEERVRGWTLYTEHAR